MGENWIVYNYVSDRITHWPQVGWSGIASWPDVASELYNTQLQSKV